MKKDELIYGSILVLTGGTLLFFQLRPDLIHNWFGANFPWGAFFAIAGLLLFAAAALRRTWGPALIAASISAAGGLQLLPPPVTFLPSREILWPLLPATAGLITILISYCVPQKRALRHTGFSLLFISFLAIIAFFSMASANLNMHLTWATLLVLAGGYFLVRASSRSA
ncbi:MAG: hypothetical protein IT308_12645 [Anaerolineaceae bacterium]|nr:hypothetical protein [Anaerolineaceae bacterium]